MDILKACKFAQSVQVYGKQETFIKASDGYEILTDRHTVQIKTLKNGMYTLTTWANIAWAEPVEPFFLTTEYKLPETARRAPGRPAKVDL